MKPGGYLSDDLKQAISQTLRAAGDDSPLKEVSTVGGGDINHAARVTTAQNRYFVKWHQSPPPRFFDCEARGICLLRDAGAVRVPDVIGHGRDRKSTRLNSSHVKISYAVFCLKKKKKNDNKHRPV